MRKLIFGLALGILSFSAFGQTNIYIENFNSGASNWVDFGRNPVTWNATGGVGGSTDRAGCFGHIPLFRVDRKLQRQQLHR